MVPLIHYQSLLLVLLCTILTICSAADTLTQSQTIGHDQTLVSSGNTFQLGFFSTWPGKNPAKWWFLGIWFTVSPDTVVWVANRDRPLIDRSSGMFAISHEGVLVLLDGMNNNNTIWSSNSSTTAISPVVQLLDSGNLVLRDKAGTVLWQSCDHPTNTFLTGMKVGKDLKTAMEWSLSSWRSSDDPSVGDFDYIMDTQGSPELYIWYGGRKKYRTGPWNGVRFSGIPEMTTFEDMFEFHFVVSAEEVSYGFKNKAGSPLSRVLLNETGVMQRMVWDQNEQAWREFWSGPKDQCDYYAKCGAFGVCNANDAMVCSCLKGFAPKAPREWYMRNTSGGCSRNTALGCGNADGFYVVHGVKLPDTHNSIVDTSVLKIEECKNRCLSNCSCTAYAATDIRGGGSGCIHWIDELIDARFVDGGQDLYIKVAQSELDATKSRKKIVAVMTIAITGFVLLLLALNFLIWREIRMRKDKVQSSDNFSGETGSVRNTECPIYDLETIRAATNNFSSDNEIGRGGFAIVYKGRLSDGQEVAVKKLSRESLQGLNEFMNEVVLIANLQHRNLVRLLGCCIPGSERILVYEYMSNKSLDAFIFDETKRATLSWKTRLDIVLGVARGLLYLHQDSRKNIIHRDLKAANILLDNDMVAKISDFGTARLFNGAGRDRLETNTETIVGTLGYMSPEYAMVGTLSFMQDVYSFGVLLLEIISGRRNQRSSNLIEFAWRLWEEGKSLDIIDATVRGTCPISELQQIRCIQVALLCVQESPNDRPAMSSVIFMLCQENSVLPQPKKPVVCAPISPAILRMQEPCSTNELTITNLEGR